MDNLNENKKVEVENLSVEKKFDGSEFGSTVVKYTAFVLIFFGFLFFLVKFILPMFN